MKGIFRDEAIAFPKFKPTVKQTINPGPAVAAIAETLFKLLEALDDNDDVQQVSANFEVSEDIIKKLSN